jgi:hypothetical protein
MTILLLITNEKETYVLLDLGFISHSRKSELTMFIKGEEQAIPFLHYGA